MKDSLDFAKAALWPAIAVIALVLFYGPIHKTLESISDRADRIQEFNLGSPFTLKIRPDELPRPSSDIASILKQIDEDALNTLLIFQENIGVGECLHSDRDESVRRHAGLVALKKLSLVEDRKAVGTVVKQVNDCEAEGSYVITKKGIAVRRYLFEFMSRLIGTATAN